MERFLIESEYYLMKFIIFHGSAVQCPTVQCSTVQCSIQCNGQWSAVKGQMMDLFWIPEIVMRWGGRGGGWGWLNWMWMLGNVLCGNETVETRCWEQFGKILWEDKVFKEEVNGDRQVCVGRRRMWSFCCCKYYVKSSDEQFVSIEASQQGTGGPVWLPLSPPSSPPPNILHSSKWLNSKLPT